MISLDEIRSNLYVWKYAMAKPGAQRYFAQRLREQYLTLTEIEDLNWRRTRALLAYAFEKVPFYRSRFSAIGLHPNDIQKPEHYAQVPVLTRDDIRHDLQNLISTDAQPRDLVVSTTGGSTGVPVQVYHERRVIRVAMGWRMLSWWGLKPGTDFASVYRDVHQGWRGHLLNWAVWWPVRGCLLDAVSPTAAETDRFLEKLRRVRPKFIHGYVGAISRLASHILERKIELTAPTAIWVTSAPLTKIHAHQIEKAFNAPVYDQYGCCEVYWLAAQCPNRGPLHMFYDVRRIEFLDDDGVPVPDGEYGNVAITDLENRLFPIIRYLNGDRGRRLAGVCSCGVNLPLMDQIKGRVADTLPLPDGRKIDENYLTTIFDDWPNLVKQFQVHQHSDSSIDVLYVPACVDNRLSIALKVVEERLTTVTRGLVPLKIIRVDGIPQTGGKLRYVRSDVPRVEKLSGYSFRPLI